MTPKGKNSSVTLPSDIYARRLANKENIKRCYRKERATRTVQALERHGFPAILAENAEEAREQVLKLIPEGASVGVGGSMTIREIGVLDALERDRHDLYDHWRPGLTQEQVLDIRRAQLTSDVFLTSANALSSDGQIVCCEAVGNRTSAMTFGPGKVIVVVGVNKIAKDLHEALQRAKEVAAPQALKDTGLAVPCDQTGSCQDCDSPQRGCRITLILERKPIATDMTVVVVGESLGF